MEHKGIWVTRGFEAFRKGTFCNAGRNIYVSRAGVLQRIHLFDLNKDGCVDLVFCSNQEHWERPPAYVYTNPLNSERRTELRSDGSPTGAVGDLNGDGYDDLVLGTESNGIRSDLNSYIYYGSPEGLSERYLIQIPTPRCTSVALGDFNGDGRPDLVTICNGKVRIFYQTLVGFEPKRFVDLEIYGAQIVGTDLDNDGFADLYILRKDQPPCVYWGGPEGISPARFSVVPIEIESEASASEVARRVSEEERIAAVSPLARVVDVDDTHHLFFPFNTHVFLLPVQKDRGFGQPLKFSCSGAVSIAAGDINSDGFTDLAFAARDDQKGKECSWVYWGGPSGFDETRRVALPSTRACDVAVGDIDGDGCAEVVLCQDQTEESYSIESMIYRGTHSGIDPEPIRLASEGARRVFIARTSDSPHPQVIYVNYRSRGALGEVPPVIYWGGPKGFSPNRRQELSGLGAAGALACDVNDDGYPDLIVPNTCENALYLDPGSYIFLGGPDGFSQSPSVAISTSLAWSVYTADLDRDGYLDFIVGESSTPDVRIFYGTADGIDLEHPERIRIEYDVVQNEPKWLCLADLNNDGWLDLLVSHLSGDRCYVLWGGPQGFSFERRQTLSVIRPCSFEAVDLTRNGYLDLIVGSHRPSKQGPHDSFVYIYWNGPEGLREYRRTQLPAKGARPMAVSDFNNDGFLDLFVCNYGGGNERDVDSYLYWGDSDGMLYPRNCTYLHTHSASGCLAADFDEDGWIDIAVANHKIFGDHIGDSFVFWNGPKGFNERHVTRLPTIGPRYMMFVGPGNISDRGPEEYYISEPFELPEGSRVHSISWNAELPPKTWVRAQLRLAPTLEELKNAVWQGPKNDNGWFNLGNVGNELHQDGRYVQYRLDLGATNSGNTPRVTEVRVAYG